MFSTSHVCCGFFGEKLWRKTGKKLKFKMFSCKPCQHHTFFLRSNLERTMMFNLDFWEKSRIQIWVRWFKSEFIWTHYHSLRIPVQYKNQHTVYCLRHCFRNIEVSHQKLIIISIRCKIFPERSEVEQRAHPPHLSFIHLRTMQ